MGYPVTVELSEETIAALGDLTAATGTPADALVREAVEAQFRHRPSPPRGPHDPPSGRLRRPSPVEADDPLQDYGGEG